MVSVTDYMALNLSTDEKIAFSNNKKPIVFLLQQKISYSVPATKHFSILFSFLSFFLPFFILLCRSI